MRPEVLFPLFRPTTALPGVGPRLARLIEHLTGPAVLDLLWHLPTGLVDRSRQPKVATARPGQIATLTVRVDAHVAPPRPRLPYKVICSDETGHMELVFFNPRVDYLNEVLPVGATRIVSGHLAAFGSILHELSRGNSALASRMVTTSPDVTVSTNLGAWVNQRGIFSLDVRNDVFRQEQVASAQKWMRHGGGQHLELGIAENNLFIMLAALGLSGPLFGTRLLPVGTLYDPFIARGLDAMNYACYQDARFMLVATPSGITLAPEGGAHQSISTPLIGLGQPGLTSFEPAYVDELALIMRWGFEHMQADDGGSVYLRLSTRAIDQPERTLSPQQETDVLAGAYWQVEPEAEAELALVYAGAVAPEVLAAAETMAEDVPGLGVLAVTSLDRVYHGWQARLRGHSGAGPSLSHIERMLSRLAPGAKLVTVQDGHPSALSWIGAATGRRVYPLGVTSFGQSADIPDLFAHHGIDSAAIVDMAATACLEGMRGG